MFKLLSVPLLKSWFSSATGDDLLLFFFFLGVDEDDDFFSFSFFDFFSFLWLLSLGLPLLSFRLLFFVFFLSLSPFFLLLVDGNDAFFSVSGLLVFIPLQIKSSGTCSCLEGLSVFWIMESSKLWELGRVCSERNKLPWPL